MNTQELEDLTLLLIRDTDEREMWIDRWAISYPTVRTAEASRDQSISEWQKNLESVWQSIFSHHVAIVAHGAGVSAWLAWLFLADINRQRQINNMILVSPIMTAFPDDHDHALLKVRCHCPTALVIGQDDPECPKAWADKQAQQWNARLIISPTKGHLNTSLQGWQWGMKLMQEMLLS